MHPTKIVFTRPRARAGTTCVRSGGGARRGPAFGLLARAAPAADDDGGSESDANSEDEYVGGTAPEGLVQDLTVRRIAGDGRCMFRALVSSEAMRRERGEGAGRPG